ncbi:Xylose isomerase domain-containing protein TIM barrel (plasmid) [Gemmatirosa kalamazoonensis]|uniref:Xylose isomerase domain-containing protein TIM barrel n=1 Tax=Gemmatirosa kalamazoonensis TaxID=861299 RepID=W0RS72_9BACT|nr:sugar phosphate isomerase/epimerase [Gemmatirosa kalamazoonensis]AHG93165.1 Xylose isomerase domain-containing protein TIM barrel [Gemmatirosa kalamazoonensis]
MSESRTSRRSFLVELAGVALGGGALAACAKHASGGVRPSPDRVGIQLYTVRDLMQQDFEGTLERVAQAGYKEMEFAGYYNRTPEQVRAVLDRLKLVSPSAHIGAQLLKENVQREIASAKTIGQSYITIPSYGFPSNAGVDAWKAAAAEFNRWGAACRDAGLKLAYHNHNREFAPIDGATSGFDVLVRETDPALVDFELDLYWATYAGQDPIALFGRYPGRFAMWHVKDMRDPQGAKTMAPVGLGTIDFKSIFAHASQSGMRHYFVEHDTAAQWPGGAIASITESARYLKQLLA